jgi:hypothetical protein
MFKKLKGSLVAALTLAAITSLSLMGAIPEVETDAPRRSTTHGEVTKFRQFARDSVLYERTSTGEITDVFINDQVSIAQIVEIVKDSTSSGDNVYFAPGTYTVPDDSTITVPSGVHVWGYSSDMDSVLFVGDGSDPAASPDTLAVFTIPDHAVNSSIHGITIDANMQTSPNNFVVGINVGQRDTSIVIENCYFKNAHAGVYVDDTFWDGVQNGSVINMTVRDNIFQLHDIDADEDAYGIYFDASKGKVITFENNYFWTDTSGGTSSGIGNTGFGAAIYAAHVGVGEPYIIIKGNNFINIDSGDSEQWEWDTYGVYIKYGPTGDAAIQVNENHFDNVRGVCLYTEDTRTRFTNNSLHVGYIGVVLAGDAQNMTVTGNVIDATEGSGILISDARGVSIGDNVFRGTGASPESTHHDSYITLKNFSGGAESIENIEIDGNQFVAATPPVYGIYFDANGGTINDIDVGDNVWEADTVFAGPDRLTSVREYPIFNRNAFSGEITEAWVSDRLTVPEIEAVIDTLNANSGGTMYIQPGDYVLPASGSGQTIDLKSNVNLVGMVMEDQELNPIAGGANFRIIGGVSGSPKAVFSINGQENIRLENLFIDANYDSAAADSVNHYGVRIYGSTNQNIIIERNEFKRCTHGVIVENGAVVYLLKIRDNRFVPQLVVGDEWRAYSVFTHTGATATGAVVSGNTMVATGATTQSGNAIYWGTDHGKIMGNYINNYDTGIGVLILAGAAHNTVSDNTFRNVAGDNISVRGTHTIVSGNNSFNSGDQGIVVEDTEWAVVSGNAVDSARTPGIRVLNSKNVTITGNTVRWSGYDASILDSRQALIALSNRDDDAPRELITDVTIVGNVLYSDTSTTLYGISFDSLDVVTNVFVGDDNIITGPATLIGGPGLDRETGVRIPNQLLIHTNPYSPSYYSRVLGGNSDAGTASDAEGGPGVVITSNGNNVFVAYASKDVDATNGDLLYGQWNKDAKTFTVTDLVMDAGYNSGGGNTLFRANGISAVIDNGDNIHVFYHRAKVFGGPNNMIHTYWQSGWNSEGTGVAALPTGASHKGDIMSMGEWSGNKNAVIQADGDTMHVAYIMDSLFVSAPDSICIVNGETGSWTEVNIDEVESVRYIALAIDSGDSLHYAAIENVWPAGVDTLKYWKSTDSGVTWGSAENVYEFGTGGVWGAHGTVAVVCDSNRDTWIAFVDASDKKLRVANDTSGTWEVEIADSNEVSAGLTTVNPLDINITSQDVVRVFYYVNPETEHKHLNMAESSADGWVVYSQIDDWHGSGTAVKAVHDSDDNWFVMHNELTTAADVQGTVGRDMYKLTTNYDTYLKSGMLYYDTYVRDIVFFNGSAWETLATYTEFQDSVSVLRNRIENDTEVISFTMNSDTLKSTELYIAGELHSSGQWTMADPESLHVLDQTGVGRGFWVLGAAASATPCTVRVGNRLYDIDTGTVTGSVWDTLYIDPSASADTTVFSDDYVVGLFRFQEIGAGDTRNSNVGIIDVWDNFGKPFTITGIRANWYTWDAETNIDIEIHKISPSTMWSYDAAGATLPTPAHNMDSDFSSNPDNLETDDYHSWYRRGLDIDVDPSLGEGILIRIVSLTTGEVPFINGTLHLEIKD